MQDIKRSGNSLKTTRKNIQMFLEDWKAPVNGLMHLQLDIFNLQLRDNVRLQGIWKGPQEENHRPVTTNVILKITAGNHLGHHDILKKTIENLNVNVQSIITVVKKTIDVQA